MTDDERTRLRRRMATLLGYEPDDVIGYTVLTVLVRELELAGWKFVPAVSTEKMEMDGKCELIALAADLATSKWAAKKVYEAMVQAAPKVTE